MCIRDSWEAPASRRQPGPPQLALRPLGRFAQMGGRSGTPGDHLRPNGPAYTPRDLPRTATGDAI
eukprot:4183302-Alexandrium_andersonii.AAC.1